MSKTTETLLLSSQEIHVRIAMGEGIVKSEVPQICKSIGGRVAIIADFAIASTYGRFLAEATGNMLLPFLGGEEAKTRECKQKFEDELLRRKFGRDTLLIGLGGGVVT